MVARRRCNGRNRKSLAIDNDWLSIPIDENKPLVFSPTERYVLVTFEFFVGLDEFFDEARRLGFARFWGRPRRQ